MAGLTGFLVVLCMLKYSDAQVTAWTEAPFTVTAGTTTVDITGSVKAKIAESTAAGTTLFTAAATGATGYAFTSGNTGDVLAISSAGVVTLAAGKSLDFEKTPTYTLVISATPASGAIEGTATLTLSITNVLEFGQSQYGVCMSDGATADTTVGTYTVSDNTASTTVTYSITSGNTNTDFALSATGVLKVATGKNLAQKTTGGYTVVLGAAESGSVAGNGATTVWIAVGTCGSSAMHVAATMGVTLLALVAAVFA